MSARFAVISSATIARDPRGRLSAAFWVKLADFAQARGQDVNLDFEAVVREFEAQRDDLRARALALRREAKKLEGRARALESEAET